jgi:predicted small metal-binding protein
VAYEFSCRAAGAEGCGFKTRAATEDELVAKVAQHAQKVHKVKNVTGTIAAYARANARQV